jgi:hypothetical protein
VCLLLKLTGLDRFVGAGYGTQQQCNRQMEEAIVAYRREESTRLAKDMPAKALTVAQDETFTGGLCRVAMDPDSHDLFLEQPAHGRDQDNWNALMEQALSGLNGHIIQSTSDEAPGLLAYVEHHRGAHHASDLFHVQQELVKAASGPLATQQRAASKAAAEAQARLDQVQGPLPVAGDEPASHRFAPSPQAPFSLEQVEHDARATSQELQRISAQREQVAQSIRRLGQADHVVDLERGVRRNGQLIAADLHDQIGRMRCVAQPEGLSQSSLDRIDKAERVVPNLQATIEFVSGYVHQQVSQLDLTPGVAFAMHARLIPALYLERVAQTRTVSAGEPHRELAKRLRTSLCEPGGAFAALAPTVQRQLQQQAQPWAVGYCTQGWENASDEAKSRTSC